MLPSSSSPPLRPRQDAAATASATATATVAAFAAVAADMRPTTMAPPSPLPPPPASARSSGVPALLTPGTTTSMPPSLSSASSSLSALSSVSPTPSPSAAATAAATATGPAAGVTASSPDLSSWDPTAPTAASAGVFLKPALAGNLATANVSQAQLGQPPNHRAAVTRARAAQLPARPPDPPPATVHELVHQPGTVWGFVEKLTTAQDRARDPGPIGAESAMSGPQSPAALQWTPRLLVLSDTALYLFSTTHDPYSQPALDALRLGPGSSLRIVADPGAPCAAVILTVSNESREWDLRCTPLPPSVSATTGADDVEAAAAVADPSRAPAPDLETQAWADRLRAAIQLGRSRSKSDVLRRANLEHAIGTAVAAAAAAAASNLQPPANEAAIRSQTQMLLPSEPGQLHEGFSTLALRASRSPSLRLFQTSIRLAPAPPFAIMPSQPPPPPQPSSSVPAAYIPPASAPRRSRSISLTRIRAQQPAPSTEDSPSPAPPVPSIPLQLVSSPLSPPLMSPGIRSAASSSSYTSLPVLSAPSPALSSPSPVRTPTLSRPRRPSAQQSNSAPPTPSPALRSSADTPTGTTQPTTHQEQEHQQQQQQRVGGLGLASLSSLFSSTSRRDHHLTRAPTLSGVIRHSTDERGGRVAAPVAGTVMRQSADLPSAAAARRWMAAAAIAAESTAAAPSSSDGGVAAAYARQLGAPPADAGSGFPAFGLRRVRSRSAGDLSGRTQFYTGQR